MKISKAYFSAAHLNTLEAQLERFEGIEAMTYGTMSDADEHALKVVCIEYDQALVSYTKLLEIFMRTLQQDLGIVYFANSDQETIAKKSSAITNAEIKVYPATMFSIHE